MIHFLHTYVPHAVLIQLGSIAIHWYGVFIVCGFLLGMLLVLWLAKQYNISAETIYDLFFYTLLFGLIGDRLYYVIYAWQYYKDNLWDVVKIWQGGLAIHGGIIAGIVTVVLFAKYSRSRSGWLNMVKTHYFIGDPKFVSWKHYFGFLADLAVVALLAGLMLGRWGNYFNQELFGKPTNLPWGIPIMEQYRPVEYSGFTYFHPTFLYESLADAFILMILIFAHLRRINLLRRHVTDCGKNNKISVKIWGNIFLLGLFWYSIVRFLNEFFRIDYSPLVLGVRWAQITSFAIIFVILIFAVYKILKLRYNKGT